MTYPANNPGEPQYTYPGGAQYPPQDQPAGGYQADFPAVYTVDAPGVPPGPMPTSAMPPAAAPQQTMGPPFGMPPTSAPPQYTQPISGGPISGPPVVGPPMVHPMSGPPMSGPPSGASGGRRLPLVPILAAAAALLLVATVVMGALFMAKSSDYNDTRRTLAAREDTLAARDSEVDRATKDLQTTKSDLESAQRQLRGVSNDNEQNKQDKETVAKCLSLLIQAINAINGGDRTLFQNKINEMKQPCEAADRIIGTT